MKKIVLSLALFALLGPLAAPGLAQSPPCTPDLYGNMICPPPNGGMMSDINGGTVCGPGLCARDSRGKVRCSSLPGGQVIINSSGDVHCVGGCVDGSKSACMKPKP